MKNFWIKVLLLLFLVGANYGCDQYTKKIARVQLSENQRLSYLNDMVHFELAENKGAFLSAGSDLDHGWHFVLLKILPLIVLVGMGVYLLTTDQFTRAQFICLACVMGGGLSNVTDRIASGSVTDFLIFSLGKLHTGILNVADLSITLGMIAFLFLCYRHTY